jgi:ribose transport system permease protein
MSKNHLIRTLVPYAGLLGALGLLILVFSYLSKNFLQAATFASIANQIPDLMLLSIGMTLILVVRGIDLSVGSLLALASTTMGVLMVKHEMGLFLSLLIACTLTTLCGAFSGFVSVWFRIPSFIVTLGMLEGARGMSKVITESRSQFIGSRIEWFGESIAGLGVSPAFLFALAIVGVGQFVLMRTVYGRYLIAIGTNEEAVRMAGIKTWPYTMSVFALSGLLCGIAGWAQTARLATADPNAGVGIELTAIAACVIGGTSLLGGRGTVVGTFLGVLIMQVLQRGLAQMGVDDAQKQIITGVVIVVAVLIDALRSRWEASSR